MSRSMSRKLVKDRRWLVEYSSNNSGGSWWLKDKDWLALERTGWRVIWGDRVFCSSNPRWIQRSLPPNVLPTVPCQGDCPGHQVYPTLRAAKKANADFLGAYAHYAQLEVTAPTDELAVAMAKTLFAAATKQDPDAEGCHCCGQPHDFSAKEVSK